jgi:uncharacterized protein DUF4160
VTKPDQGHATSPYGREQNAVALLVPWMLDLTAQHGDLVAKDEDLDLAIDRSATHEAAFYWDDHNPPHYHAVYGEHEAWIVIADAAVLHGRLPTRALRLVRSWHRLHQDELETAWNRARSSQAPGTIEPLP